MECRKIANVTRKKLKVVGNGVRNKVRRLDQAMNEKWGQIDRYK